MQIKRVQTVMTYDQWKAEYKKRIRKSFMDAISTFFQWIVLTLLFTGFPLGMIIHWAAVGY